MFSNTQKLRVLRARTDFDLVVLIRRELDRGLTAADLASTKSSPLYAQALKAHGAAVALIPRIAGLSQEDRLGIEARVKELRSRLDQVPLYANLRSGLASLAS